MVKYKLAYVLSAAALMAGTGVFVPGVVNSAFAEGTTVSDYESLDMALCEGGEIVLGADINVDAWLATGCGWVISNDTIVDFNGHTITSAANRGYNIDFQDATLTFKDSVGGGGYTQLGEENIAIAITNGKFILDGGTINANTWGVVLWHDSEFEMNGGSIVADNLAISGNGTTNASSSNYGSNVKITINDGVLESKNDWAIYNPSENSTIDIYGGSITGGSGAIAANRGTINIYDGEFKSLGTAEVEGDVSQDGTRGYENAVIGIPKEYGPVTLNIYGGKFINENGAELIADVSGLDNENVATVEISGGLFATEPSEDEIENPVENEADIDEETGMYAIFPKKIDYMDDYIEDGGEVEGHVSTAVEFGGSLIADRKAVLSAVEVSADQLTLDENKGGELIGAVDITMFERDGVTVIPVENNQLKIYIDLDEESHAMLTKYDHLFAVYFENGVETERFEASLSDPEDGYYLSFETTHLSTYGVVGVNDEDAAATPETGTMTAVGASAATAAIVTAVAVGLLVSIVSFAYLIRRK